MNKKGPNAPNNDFVADVQRMSARGTTTGSPPTVSVACSCTSTYNTENRTHGFAHTQQ